MCARQEPERKGEGYDTGAHWHQSVKELLGLPKARSARNWSTTEYHSSEGQQVARGGKHESAGSHYKDVFGLDHHTPRVSSSEPSAADDILGVKAER
jgi:hypothetical protein